MNFSEIPNLSQLWKPEYGVAPPRKGVFEQGSKVSYYYMKVGNQWRPNWGVACHSTAYHAHWSVLINWIAPYNAKEYSANELMFIEYFLTESPWAQSVRPFVDDGIYGYIITPSAGSRAWINNILTAFRFTTEYCGMGRLAFSAYQKGDLIDALKDTLNPREMYWVLGGTRRSDKDNLFEFTHHHVHWSVYATDGLRFLH